MKLLPNNGYLSTNPQRDSKGRVLPADSAVYRQPEYSVWRGMISRCEIPCAGGYKYYGGTGITVHLPWRLSFWSFIADVGPRPSARHSLDRFPDPNGNYVPGNVRWATRAEQSRNKANNRWIEFNGERMILNDWARRIGITKDTLRNRLSKYPLEVALSPDRMPPGRKPNPRSANAEQPPSPQSPEERQQKEESENENDFPF